jgi:GR25 family glycosyltransferase involved in LPS biosynthesis
MWTDLIGQIYLINLDKRMDRLSESLRQLDEYNIPFKRISAIEDKENGARGLRDTMNIIYQDAIDNNYESILVLEDDFLFVENPNNFMGEVIKQLPENWHICFLGCQPTNGFLYRQSANLLNLQKAFATHAVMYSKQCIKEIMSMGMGYPIDNWLVDNIEILGQTYCTYPFLCTQSEGESNIGNTYIDWRPFMQPRYEQKLAEMPQ